MRGEWKLLIAVMVLAWSPWFLGAFQTWQSGSGFELTPANSDNVSDGDDRIRELKENIRNRLQSEHYFGTGVGASDNGRHREGSASAWNTAPCPTANVTGDAGTGSTAYTSADKGKLCAQPTDGSLQVYSGSAYIAAMSTFFNNTLGHWTNNSAPTDTFDPTKFHIRGIYNDTTIDTAGCLTAGHYSTTALASQVFGDAGAACFTTGTINLTGRSTTSRGILIAHLSGIASAAGGTPKCQFTVYRDSTANQIGDIVGLSGPSSLINENIGTTVSYVTGLSAGNHEFALHALDTTSTSECNAPTDPNAGYLTFIDLGPEYP